MKNMLKLASLLGLVMTIVPPILFFLGKTDLGQMKLWMGVGMTIWFVSAPFWINQSSGQSQ